MKEDFLSRVKTFNQMYGLPTQSVPQLPGPKAFLERQEQFHRMLEREVEEGNEVYVHNSQIDTLVNMADWLGDICVYCASEAARYGIPLGLVLDVIMDSNASKLGADGQPIVIDGKVQKGPNYWKPEPRIKEVLLALQNASTVEIKS